MPKDLFSEENITTSNYFKFANVGDQVSGVYVDKREITNTMSQPPKQQRVYTLINDADGQPIDVYGKGKEPQTLPGLEAAKFGQVVGIRFDKEEPSKVKGYSPTKYINVYSTGDMKPEVLAEYQAERAGIPAPPVGSVDKDDVPFE